MKRKAAWEQVDPNEAIDRLQDSIDNGCFDIDFCMRCGSAWMLSPGCLNARCPSCGKKRRDKTHHVQP